MSVKVSLDNPSIEELIEVGKGAVGRSPDRNEEGDGVLYCPPDNVEVLWTNCDFNKRKGEIARVFEHMRNNPMIKMDRVLRQNGYYKCRLFISEKYPDMAMWWGKTLATENFTIPNTITYCIPEWPSEHVFVFPKCPDNPYVFPITIILGSDYLDELRMSFLRQFMYEVKFRKDSLGLYAASKMMTVYGKDGDLEDNGILLFGLRNLYKASLLMNDHGLTKPEKVSVKQFGVISFTPDGQALGLEERFFSSLEDSEREPCWFGDNADFDSGIDLARVDKIFFMTPYNDIMPPIVKLTSPEWGALAFMLGEGGGARVAGMNPFIMGDKAEEGNIFLRILKANRHIQCYLLNTGSIGGVEHIELEVSALIMRREIEGKIKWKRNDYWKYLEPYAIEGIDLARFDPNRFYRHQRIAGMNYSLRMERRAWMEQFKGRLAPEIVALLD